MKIYDWALPDNDKYFENIIKQYVDGIKKCSCVNGMIPVYGGKPYPCPNCSPKFKSEPK